MLIKAIVNKELKNIHIQKTDKQTYCDSPINSFAAKMNTDWFQWLEDGHVTFNKYNVCIACLEKFKKDEPEAW